VHDSKPVLNKGLKMAILVSEPGLRKEANMAQPIYKVWLTRPTEAWYALTQAEKDKLMTAHGEAAKEAGLKPVINCDSSWCSDMWLFWGVEKYPSMKAEKKFHALLVKLDWFRYFESLTLLGAAVP
jgi:hypothetical protein